MLRRVSIILIAFFFSVNGFSQTDSTVVVADTIPVINDGNIKNIKTIVENDTVKPHSPKKAMLLSAVLPGAGQIYNQKYWKAPIVWAGFVALGYFIGQNNREYHRFKKAYIYSTDKDSSTISEFPFASPDQIANERNIYRKWRDLSVILTVGWYALSIIDANVDAHLFEFDVSDVATLRWEPSFNLAFNQPQKPFSGGVKFTLGF